MSKRITSNKILTLEFEPFQKYSFSRIKLWRRCHQAHYYKYYQGLEKIKKGLPLLIGSTIHEVLEEFTEGRDPNVPMAKFRKDFDKLFNEEKAELGDLPTELEGIMVSYFKHYENDGLSYPVRHRGLMSEFPVIVDLDNETQFVGYVDKIPQDSEGRNWVMDHKCLWEGTPILTPEGYLELKEIKKGGLVISSRGSPVEVTEVTNKFLLTYQISTKSGKVLVSTGEHKWPIHYRSSRSAKFKSLEVTVRELRELRGDCFLIPSPPVLLPEKDLAIDPWAMGALLGDGSFRRKTISFCNQSVTTVTKFLSLIPQSNSFRRSVDVSGTHHIHLNKGLWAGHIEEWGMLGLYSHEKFIPEEYLISSLSQRTQLLCGMMDTDGSSIKGIPIYCTSSKRMALDFIRLVESLGGVPQLRVQKSPRYQNGRGRDSWRIKFNLPLGSRVFNDPLKQSKIKEPRRKLNSMLLISSVDLLGELPVVDLEVDSPDHLFISDGVLTHNSCKSIPQESSRFADYQLLIYHWLLPQLGYPKMDGVIWDYIRKKAPTVPELLKTGGLSRAKSIDTTYSVYIATVDRLLGPEARPEYEEFAQTLKGREEKFLRRIYLPKPNSAMVNTVVQDLMFSIGEIREKGPTSTVRSMTKDCNWCQYYNLCQAELRGLDSDFIRKAEYQIKGEADAHNQKEVISSEDESD